jgi:hypothetical protein
MSKCSWSIYSASANHEMLRCAHSSSVSPLIRQSTLRYTAKTPKLKKMLQQQGSQQQVEMLSAVKTLLAAAKSNNSTSLAMSSTDASISSTPAVAGTTVYVKRDGSGSRTQPTAKTPLTTGYCQQ